MPKQQKTFSERFDEEFDIETVDRVEYWRVPNNVDPPRVKSFFLKELQSVLEGLVEKPKNLSKLKVDGLGQEVLDNNKKVGKNQAIHQFNEKVKSVAKKYGIKLCPKQKRQ